MARDLLGSLEVIRVAAEEIRREKWCWQNLRETQKLRWRPAVTGQLAPIPSLNLTRSSDEH
jgi:hypothetical protein